MAQKLYIQTNGCQMNEYDSEKMRDVLQASHGMEITQDPEEADVLLLNTCSIREKAQEKVFSAVGRWRKIKNKRPDVIIGVGGCVASQEGAALQKRAPYVDIVFGPQTLHRLPELLNKARETHQRVVDISFPEIEKFDALPEPRAEGPKAFVSIMEGCSKYCTFCVVPYTRGAEYSRPGADVMAEAKRLAATGVREITLLGQNVNNYQGAAPKGDWGLGRLIAEVATVDGIERIRYTTSYPADMDDELIAAHADVNELMPFLHLPVQSGSDVVLKAMNRRHNADDYRRLVDRLRVARPDIGLSSDFIVGFPGETDADFAETMKLVEEIGFIQAYSFKYSPRPGTPAAVMDTHVPDKVKGERLAILQDRLNTQQLSFNRSCVGKVMAVLLDRPGREPGQLVGRSPYMQAVHVDGTGGTMGVIAGLRITEAHANSLTGAPVEDYADAPNRAHERASA